MHYTYICESHSMKLNICLLLNFLFWCLACLLIKLFVALDTAPPTYSNNILFDLKVSEAEVSL